MKNGENITVLLIDDDIVVRNDIASYLSEQAYRVIQAGNHHEAIDRFHSSSPNIVVCNIQLPGEEKFATLDRIFSEVPNQPMIVMADESTTEDVIVAMRLGASDYLIKPIVDMAVLEFSIQSSLKRARIEEENKNYRRNLELINQELEHTLKLFQMDQQAGRQIQKNMLPKPPQVIADFRFNHKVIPSLYLSGDLVDYQPISHSKVLLYIADVSGHGSSSAFVTVLVRFRVEQMRREHIRSRFKSEFSPSNIVSILNADLLDSGLDKHITLFMGILDKVSNTLTYSIAGHHPLPVYFNGDSARFLKMSKNSLPIGLMEKAEYSEQSMELDKEFYLTLFSDGVLEVMPQSSLEQKETRLLDVIKQSRGQFDSIKDMLGLDNTANLPDDIAVMCVSRK